ncbi:hypothetical protein OUZ56_010507 [Daphnia magna]|uniref:Uncharacterized protein n=1 Tax=Daphnia magna TaxID=35525 RepID=A0ABR0AIR3_9CRUS|nr:hypothetical protein OUZ56_010507 [Daphnia magna]
MTTSRSANQIPCEETKLEVPKQCYVDEAIQVFLVIIIPKKGEIVWHSHFVTLFEWDNPKDAGMGVAFRLRHEHVFPNSFSKMNVRFMAQIILTFRRKSISVISTEKSHKNRGIQAYESDRGNVPYLK